MGYHTYLLLIPNYQNIKMKVGPNFLSLKKRGKIDILLPKTTRDL